MGHPDQMNGKPQPPLEREVAYGLSFGPNVEEDVNFFAYDREFERQMMEKSLATRTVAPREAARGSAPGLMFGIDDEDDIPQSSYVYDGNFEAKMAAKAIRNGKGYFLRRDWLFINGSEVCLNERRPLLLYTQGHDAEPGTECSKAHDQHLFVALVHLLKHADVGSTVFISMPYFTDVHVMDELCHFAQSEEKGGRNLVINVVLSQTVENKQNINAFIGGNPDIQQAVERLGLRSTRVHPGFCNSKAVWSTAGTITGSCNFAHAARLHDQEHGVLLGPGHEDNEQLRRQLEERWNRATPMVPATPTQTGTKRPSSSISI